MENDHRRRFTLHVFDSFALRPVAIDRSSTTHPFLSRPVFAPLLFDNNSSDARDHCANERNFLSWLRLSVYMSIVSVAIIVSFHLKSKPSSVEEHIALPVGLLFWVLSVACLVCGCAIYVKTVTKYSRRQALVQSGWKTQVLFTIIACAIIAACILFLSTNALSRR